MFVPSLVRSVNNVNSVNRVNTLRKPPEARLRFVAAYELRFAGREPNTHFGAVNGAIVSRFLDPLCLIMGAGGANAFRSAAAILSAAESLFCLGILGSLHGNNNEPLRRDIKLSPQK